MLNESCRIQITSLIAAMQTYQAKEDSQNSFLNKVHQFGCYDVNKGNTLYSPLSHQKGALQLPVALVFH